jgi:alkylation response protein AidB-like acyl-CoA dehydrogenase
MPTDHAEAIQFPLVELHTDAAMLRQLIRSTAWSLDRHHRRYLITEGSEEIQMSKVG